MNREQELAKNTIIIFVGKICTQFLSFFLLPVYTRLLSTEEYGLVDLYTTCQMLIIYIIYAQIEQAIFRFIVDHRKDVKDRVEISSTVFLYYIIASIVLAVLFLGVCSIFDIPFASLLYANVLFCAMTNIVQQYLRGLGDNVGYSVGSFICAMMTILANMACLVLLQMGAKGMLLGNLCGYICGSIFMLIRSQSFRYFKLSSVSVAKLKELLIYSLPLVPNALSWWIMSASDRMIVSAILGNSKTGLLAVAQKFSTVYSNMYTMFHMSWSESASLHIMEGDKDKFLQGVINTVLRLFASIAVGLILVMPFLFDVLVDDGYYEAYYLIPIYVLAAFFNVIQGLYSVVYIALKRTKDIAKTTIFAAVINLLVNLLCIQKIGMYAAAVSSLVSYMVISIYRYYDIKKYVKVPINKKDIEIIIILFSITFVTYYVRNTILSGFTLISVFAFCVYFNWAILVQGFGIILKKIRR